MKHKVIKVTEDKNSEMENCSRFDRCCANICPLDPKARKRTYVPGEDICPFAIKKRKKYQKGLITRAPDDILRVLSESNSKMLNRGNWRRWCILHK